MKVKTIYKSRVLRPVGDLDLDEGEEVELCPMALFRVSRV